MDDSNVKCKLKFGSHTEPTSRTSHNAYLWLGCTTRFLEEIPQSDSCWLDAIKKSHPMVGLSPSTEGGMLAGGELARTLQCMHASSPALICLPSVGPQFLDRNSQCRSRHIQVTNYNQPTIHYWRWCEWISNDPWLKISKFSNTGILHPYNNSHLSDD